MTQHRKLGPEGPASGTSSVEQTTAKSRSQARSLELYAAVALGSVIGGVLRAAASLVLQAPSGTGFPWATLLVNVTGSFVIGFYATLTGPDGRLLVGPRQRQFVMTGICGGYTTFSMFSLETLRLWQTGHPATAGFNVCVSIVTWLAAVWLGHALATRFNRLKGV